MCRSAKAAENVGLSSVGCSCYCPIYSSFISSISNVIPPFLCSAMDKSHTVKLFVGNLALDTTQEELSAIFEPYGQVVSCSVLRQFAFVHLQGEGAADRAVRELNGREFRGRNLVVEESRGRPLHSTKVFVGNLSGMCTTEDLKQLFQTFGKVLECDKVKGEQNTL